MSNLATDTDALSDFLEASCPASMRTPMTHEETVWGGRRCVFPSEDAKTWFDAMSQAGLLAPTWPVEYGGAGFCVEQSKLLQKLLKTMQARPALTSLGVHMMGPTILEFGNDEQKLEHLPGIAQGSIRWCQGYSEPGAGSDLASLKCKAEDKGDHYLVNGQKVWTSFADKSDYLFCLVRTDFSAPKHEGISVLLIDMDSEGVTSKPIDLISGNSHFCEVFLDNVKVPKRQLLGELNKGWSIAKRMLQHERNMMGQRELGERYEPNLYQLIQDYVSCSNQQQVLRDQASAIYMREQAIAATSNRVMQEFKAGIMPQASSTLKLAMSECFQDKYELLVEIEGFAGLSWPDARNEGVFSEEELLCAKEWAFSKVQTLGGGSSEIQHNIIAKRNLGLPE